MDKITCIAFILYESAKTKEAKNLAIKLLNGDLSLQDLKKNLSMLPDVKSAEISLKKGKIDMVLVRKFAEKFLLVEA